MPVFNKQRSKISLTENRRKVFYFQMSKLVVNPYRVCLDFSRIYLHIARSYKISWTGTKDVSGKKDFHTSVVIDFLN